MIKTCIVCQKEFETKNWATKSCSKECRLKYNNNRRKRTNLNHLDKFNCVYCGKEVIRYRKRNGFCSRSCASKKYIEDGTYNSWRLKIQEKKGINKNCVICEKEFYAEPHEIENKKLCGEAECRKKYMSAYMFKNNPVKGTKENPETREKIKKTLLERYGVTNAYDLAKHTSLSKPQKELTEYLSKNTNNTVISNFAIMVSEKCYKVDILIKETNTIIEFNGTYWHCDPRFYKEDYFNKKKQKFAKEIWQEDKERIENLKKMGYEVKIVWEIDYNNNKENIIKEILNG